MQLSSETPPPPVNQPPESNGLAVASFVRGLISTVSICICYISIPLAITGLILGIVAKKRREGNGMRTAGIVLSILGIVISLAYILLIVIIVATEDTNYNY
jgi:thiol:disulfide interchange protein